VRPRTRLGVRSAARSVKWPENFRKCSRESQLFLILDSRRRKAPSPGRCGEFAATRRVANRCPEQTSRNDREGSPMSCRSAIDQTASGRRSGETGSRRIELVVPRHDRLQIPAQKIEAAIDRDPQMLVFLLFDIPIEGEIRGHTFYRQRRPAPKGIQTRSGNKLPSSATGVECATVADDRRSDPGPLPKR
jgi:hypothetical protein